MVFPLSWSRLGINNDEEYEDVKATWDDDEMKELGGLKQGEQYAPLEIVEPRKKRTTREHHIVSFKNNWASDGGSQGIGLKKSKMRLSLRQ